MKVYREVRRIEEIITEEPIRHKPKYKVGDYRTIYSGSYEGFGVTLKDVRWNDMNSGGYSFGYVDKYGDATLKIGFQYLTNYGWIHENNLE